ncbi:type III glutamate--ammonia ligase [Dietzia sp. PP-33]|jgi:glutamine synthetase|uniref:type III glutamate--ammonia ligase n=1 Tax=Dietzia sp. PP-33 TaxID=2957500 RepID=UPI0029BA5567|nr:type III glutamate--ammonia ligase [Dietzia sp. PP-33]MDX2357624.1 type III glutamate--ammonia ligase [Dietzia sp. PP-33]
MTVTADPSVGVADHANGAEVEPSFPSAASTAAVGSAPGTLVRLVADSGTRFVLAVFTNLRGKPCAKLVPASAVDQLEAGELGFAGYAADAIGQQPRDPDLLVVPDPRSFTSLDFIKPGLALVHCDPWVSGEPWRFAPRVILGRMLADAARDGLELKVGAEVEYFLVRKNADGSLRTADPKDDESHPCYDARGVTRMYEHLAGVSDAMNVLGWANYANDHEDGNGQFEQNFAYDEAMVTADRVMTLRYIISMLAEQRDMIATFMPKPFSDRTGSGMHLHMSLWRDGDPVFPAAEEDPYGLGLSPTAYSFIAGVLAHASGMHSVLCPTINSYKRIGARTTASGATWSPTDATYGGNDRTHYLRVPDGNRVELRGGDGSANPYLAVAVQLAAGLDGVRRDLDPGPPATVTDATHSLPPTLLHAVEEMRRDEVVRAALDIGGDGVAEYYADLKREEFISWHNTVTQWEIDEYLTAL